MQLLVCLLSSLLLLVLLFTLHLAFLLGSIWFVADGVVVVVVAALLDRFGRTLWR